MNFDIRNFIHEFQYTDDKAAFLADFRIVDVLYRRSLDFAYLKAENDKVLPYGIYMDLISLRTPSQVILTLLQREFSRLVQIKELQEAKEAESEIARRVGLSPWIVKKNYLPITKSLDSRRLMRSLQQCLQADQDYKSGLMDAGVAVEMTLLRLCS